MSMCALRQQLCINTGLIKNDRHAIFLFTSKGMHAWMQGIDILSKHFGSDICEPFNHYLDKKNTVNFIRFLFGLVLNTLKLGITSFVVFQLYIIS